MPSENISVIEAEETPAIPLPETVTESETPKRSTTTAIREEAGKLGAQAADRARTLADQGKAKATDALDGFSRMMNDAAGSVDDRLGERYGQYARSAADSLSGFAQTLRDKKTEDLLEGATGFVRKSPVVAVGIAAAFGFALARLLQSGVDASSRDKD